MPSASSLSLHNSARTGDLAELGKCLSEDVDVNAVDKHQRTALHLAAWAGHSDIVKALLSAPGIQTKICAMDQMTALHFGAMNGHTEVCRILLNAGIPVNTKTRKAITPLHFACQKGHDETVQLLLKRKAAPYMKDSKGENALDKCKNSDVCRDAVQAAMDAAAASGTAFSKKRGRKEDGLDGDAAATTGDQKHHANASSGNTKGVQDDSGDDDDEEDIIPLKRPLVAPRPAPRPHPQPTATAVAPHTASESLQASEGGAAATSSQHCAAVEAPASEAQADIAKPSEGAVQEPAAAAAVRPPVATPMRPPVARGPSRALPAGGGPR